MSQFDFDTIESNPLYWPPNVPRTKRPMRSNFKEDGRQRSVYSALSDLRREIDLLGGKNIIVSTNMSTKKDGDPYSNAREPEDSGVGVYFILDGEPMCYPNDKWDRVADNIYAIAKTINAQRGIDRWGSPFMVNAQFTGFKMLPEQGSGTSWHTYFKVDPHTATEHEIVQRFRARAKKVHPDKPTGSPELFQEARTLYDQAITAIKSRQGASN